MATKSQQPTSSYHIITWISIQYIDRVIIDQCIRASRALINHKAICYNISGDALGSRKLAKIR
jgi:hypothetical protein